MKPRTCFLCGKHLKDSCRRYCPRCRRFSKRLWVQRFSPEVIKYIFDYVRKHGFVCHYTGMKLEMNDRKSPWYIVLDHWMPHDDRRVVLTSALVNDMKSDLTEDEFWYYIRQLANFRKYGTKIRKRKLEMWWRLDPMAA